MKKAGKVILIFLAAIILLAVLTVGTVMIFKPDLVRAVYDGFMLDSEQIEEKKKENDKQLINTIKDFGLNMSEEDLERLGNGELSEEEMKDILLGDKKEDAPEKTPENEDSDPLGGDKPVSPDNVPENNVIPENSQPDTANTDVPAKPPKQDNPNVTDKTTQTQPEKTPEKVPEKAPDTNKPDDSQKDEADSQNSEQMKAYEEKTAELVAKMYALKSQYIGQINGVVASMKAEYAALPKEQQNMASKTSIANSYLGKITALEAQCDAQVNAVVTELRDVLKKSGKDMSLADAIIEAYNREKETTKAAYINKYSD